MPAKKLAALTAFTAMLSFNAPARAAYVENINFNDVVFSGGDVASGDIYITPSLAPSSAAFIINGDFSIDGEYWRGRTSAGPNSASSNSSLYTNGFVYTAWTLTYNPAGLPDLGLSDFTLTNIGQGGTTDAVSGEISCVSGCIAATTPLPPALPLFASAILACWGFGTWRKRRAQAQ